jgi:Fic family protein
MRVEITQQIIDYLIRHPGSSSKQIYDAFANEGSYATIKRILRKVLNEGLIITNGRGKGTIYRIAPSYSLLHSVPVDAYFQKEIDDRIIKHRFEFNLLRDVLPQAALFTPRENEHLKNLHTEFVNNLQQLSHDIRVKEMERLAIDLSWKSSQIEGNTYSLLETERLLKDKETAAGKPKDDATMLLNHKEAINFILNNPDYIIPLSVRTIEDIHSILIKDLNVDRNLRTRRVGISGTNYRPLDNEHQILEAMQESCALVNDKPNVFEKALLCLALISYVQPFNDGNKRTSRIVSNAILLASGYCPLSFRTVDAVDYKKAMLIFYEQNNLSPFKKIFMEQYEFAVKTYF